MKVLAVTLLAFLAASAQAGKLTDSLVKVVPSFATGFVVNGTRRPSLSQCPTTSLISTAAEELSSIQLA